MLRTKLINYGLITYSMVIDGNTIKEASFYDYDANKSIKVDLSVRDIILFRLMERLIGAISGVKR